MGATFNRLKNWAIEILTNTDLNAEIDNILENLDPSGVGGYSESVPEMQLTTDPGEVGSESLAASLAGEIERLRFAIQEIKGLDVDEWYETPSLSLTDFNTAVGDAIPPNRIGSGLTRTDSLQPAFLVPDGTARTVTLKGATVPFVYYINGVQYTISTDVTLTGLTAGPNASITCLVNKGVTDDEYTKYLGENNTTIPVDNVQSSVSARVGLISAFRIDNGSASEYFIATLDRLEDDLIGAKRGYFFNSASDPIPRIVFSNNDTITLMRIGWIFATTTGTLTATYNEPLWAAVEPTSPAVGDYWYDTENETWKVYTVGTYVVANATLIGMTVQNATQCVAARSFEFAINYNALNTCQVVAEIDSPTTSKIRALNPGAKVSVWGNTIYNQHNYFRWDIATDCDTGVVIATEFEYYLYLTETGVPKISDVRPYDRRADLLGFYHPHHSWRCVGLFWGAGTTALNFVISIHKAGVKVTPRSVLTGALAASITWSTNTTWAMSFEIQSATRVSVSYSGTLSGAPDSNPLSVGIPLPFSPPGDVLSPVINQYLPVGQVNIWDNSATLILSGNVVLDGNGLAVKCFQQQSTDDISSVNVTQAVPITFAADDVVVIRAEIPVNPLWFWTGE